MEMIKHEMQGFLDDLFCGKEDFMAYALPIGKEIYQDFVNSLKATFKDLGFRVIQVGNPEAPLLHFVVDRRQNVLMIVSTSVMRAFSSDAKMDELLEQVKQMGIE